MSQFFISIKDEECIKSPLDDEPLSSSLPSQLSARLSIVSAKSPREVQASLSSSIDAAERKRGLFSFVTQQRLANQRAKREAAKLARERSQERLGKRKTEEMQAKAYVAAWRRCRLWRVPRSRLLEEDLPEKKRLEEMATVVTRAWLYCSYWRPAMMAFEAVAAGLLHGQGGELEALKELITKKEVISQGDQLMRRLVQGDVIAVRKKLKGGRMLLMGLLSASCGQDIESTLGLPASIGKLSLHLKTSLDGFWHAPCRATQRMFLRSWIHWLDGFEQWRLKDRKELLESMVADWLDTESLKRKMEREGAEAREEWLPPLLHYQKQLEESILKFSGRLGWLTLKQAKENLKKEETQREEVLPEQEKEVEVSQERDTVFKTIENVQLAHDIVIRESLDFVDIQRLLGMEAKPLGNLEKATASDLVDFIVMVRNQLGDLLLGSKGGQMREQLTEQFDEQLMREQVLNKALPAMEIIGSLVKWIGLLCAPIRDQAVSRLARLCIEETSEAEEQRLKSLCQEISKTLTEMNSDYGNYLLAQLRPAVFGYIVEYEREAFAQLVLQTEQAEAVAIHARSLKEKELLTGTRAASLVFLDLLNGKECLLTALDHRLFKELKGELNDIVRTSALALTREALIREAIETQKLERVPLCRLLKKRAMDVVKDAFFQRRITDASLKKKGFDEESCKKLKSISEMVVRMVKLHQQVYGPIYDAA